MSKYTTITLEEVNSTNTYALENIACLDNASIIYTKSQTNGRGRYNRNWVYDDTSNLYMSIVLKPKNIENYPFANLTQYLSVVLCNFLEKNFNLNPKIKWPNDILINGSKISGILAESYMKSNKIEAIVLGLGLNVNLKQETLDSIDQKAVSLSVLKGKTFDVDLLLTQISDVFFENYDEFVKQGFSFIKDDYISKCDFLGKNITVKEQNTVKHYFAKTIDNDGLLIVNDENDNECKIITGDVLC